jgi:hypothetical protein
MMQSVFAECSTLYIQLWRMSAGHPTLIISLIHISEHGRHFYFPSNWILQTLVFMLSPKNAAHFIRRPWSVHVCVTQLAVIPDFFFDMLFRSINVDVISWTSWKHCVKTGNIFTESWLLPCRNREAGHFILIPNCHNCWMWNKHVIYSGFSFCSCIGYLFYIYIFFWINI